MSQRLLSQSCKGLQGRQALAHEVALTAVGYLAAWNIPRHSVRRRAAFNVKLRSSLTPKMRACHVLTSIVCLVAQLTSSRAVQEYEQRDGSGRPPVDDQRRKSNFEIQQ